MNLDGKLYVQFLLQCCNEKLYRAEDQAEQEYWNVGKQKILTYIVNFVQ